MTNNIKIGSIVPNSILYDGKNEPETISQNLTYYKYANDAGGYFFHGLWIAPNAQDRGVYWWPWDLNVPSGALKDVNDGWARWGYVHDGKNKNVSAKINTAFPGNGWENQKWGASILIGTNERNTNDNTCFDFGNHPITITFLDDRFDDCEWTVANGAVADISEDKRTFTIHRVNNYCQALHGSSIYTFDEIHEKFKSIIVSVSGLDYHFRSGTTCDVTSDKCWDAYLGEDILYHEDHTWENTIFKYNIGKITKLDSKRSVISFDQSLYKDVTYPYIPPITNLDEYIFKTEPTTTEHHTLVSEVKWNAKPSNPDFWDNVKEWYRTHNIYTGGNTTFYGGNIGGELTLNIAPLGTYDKYPLLNDIFRETLLEKITLNIDPSISIIGTKNLFLGASRLIEIVTDYSVPANLLAGYFEFCSNLKSIPPKFINWGAKDEYFPLGKTNMFATYEGCDSLMEIPSYNEEDRFAENNTIRGNGMGQTFNGCYALRKIGPVVDLIYTNPANIDNNNYSGGGYALFNDCTLLSDVRIKNLNHNTWYFDGTGKDLRNNGNIPNLDQESIAYLFDNMVDLTTHDEKICTSNAGNCFGSSYWSYSGATEYLYSASITKRLTSSTAANNWQTLYTSKAVDADFKIEGLTDGDRIEFGNGYIAESENSITTNSIYHITNAEGSTNGFQLYNESNPGKTNWVTISIASDRYDPANPKSSSAELHCPAKWSDKITSDMITSAISKGWTIYIGGVKQE